MPPVLSSDQTKSIFGDESAPELCARLLNGEWSRAYMSGHIFCSPVNIGRSNQLFICEIVSNSNEKLKTDSYPTKVMVRFYGSEHTGKGNRYKSISDETELKVLDELHRRKMAPKVYAAFDGGRIEEYIESTKLTLERLRTVPMLSLMARKIARFHSSDGKLLNRVDIHAIFDSVRNDVNQKLNSLHEDPFNHGLHPKSFRLIRDFLLNENLHSLVESAKKTFRKMVFAHMDLNFTNFLILKSDLNNNFDPDSVMIIDIENSMISYRANDLGKFFAELCFGEDHGQIWSIPDSMIDTFCEIYLEEWKTIGGTYDINIDTVERIVAEVKIGLLYSMIFHIHWNVLHPNFFKKDLQQNTLKRIGLFKHFKNRWMTSNSVQSVFVA